MNVPEHIDHGMNNLLNIDEADSYYCRVSNMFTNDVFSGLSIAVSKTGSLKSDLFLYFNRVIYIEGQVFWQGANLQTVPIEQRDEFIKRSNIKLPDSLNYFMFEIGTQAAVTRVIAYSISSSQDIFELEQKTSDELCTRISIDQRSKQPIILKSEPSSSGKTLYSSSSVDTVLFMFQQGRRFDEILHMMPWLEPEDIQACLAYARQRLK